MKILIVGGAGFIGKNFVEKYYIANEIYVVDSLDPLIHGSDTSKITKFLKKCTAKFLIADYASKESFEFIDLVKPEIIISMASQTGTADGNVRVDYYLAENIDKFSRFINHVRFMKNLKKIIHLSTRAVYGNGCSNVNNQVVQNGYRKSERLSAGIFNYEWEDNAEGLYIENDAMQPTVPVSIYGVTKLTQEGLLSSLAGDLSAVILRLQNVIGKGQSLLNPYTGLTCWFTQAALSGANIQIYENGEIWRDFIDVEDVIQSIYKAVKIDLQTNEIIDIGSGIAVNLVDFAKLIITKVGSNSEIEIVKKYRVGDIRWAAANVENSKEFGIFSKEIKLEKTVQDFIDSVQQTQR